jgi:hypothetical protein
MPAPRESDNPDQAQTTAANTWTLACLVALVGLLVALLGKDLEQWALLPFVVGVVVTLARLGFGPPLVLISLVGVLWGFDFDYSPVGLMDWLIAFSMLAFVACFYRLLSLTRNALPLDSRPQGRRRFLTMSRRPHLRKPESVRQGELPLVVLTALVWTSLGIFLFGELRDLNSPFRPDLPGSIWRAIVVLWAGSLVLAAAWAVVGYLGRLQASPQENLQYLQDQLWLETYRDQARLGRWLTWARLRFQRRKEKS